MDMEATLAYLAATLGSAQPARPAGLVRQVRDLSVLALTADSVLVVACDSLGAIGPKPGDAVHVTADVVGYFAARVPLLEVLCAGATPVLVVNALAVEWEPTGRAILAGVRDACSEAGLDAAAAITGSTEENVATNQTGVGVTVLGVASRSGLRPGTARGGDNLYLIGTPKSAPEQHVERSDPEMVTFADVLALLEQPAVHDLLPVGSRGAQWEARQLADSAHLTLQLDTTLDAATSALLERSGGPATALLVAASATPLTRAPLWYLGRLV